MINRVPAYAAGLLAVGLAFANPASGTPLTGALAIAGTAPNHVEAVRWAGGGGGRGPVVAGGARAYGGYGRGPVYGGGYARPGWGGGGWGYGVGAAVVGGAIIGGALAAPYYGYGPYYPAPYPYYAEPVYEAPPDYAPVPPGAYAPPPGAGAYGQPPGDGGGDPSGYCAQRYRSYDPQSGTYIGNDGLRHPCP